MSQVYRSGETVPFSGQYQKAGPRGQSGPEVTCVKGEPFPPAPAGWWFVLVDRTKNKSGGGGSFRTPM